MGVVFFEVVLQHREWVQSSVHPPRAPAHPTVLADPRHEHDGVPEQAVADAARGGGARAPAAHHGVTVTARHAVRRVRASHAPREIQRHSSGPALPIPA